jgi:GNAT superfamily N-acetyltransferase
MPALSFRRAAPAATMRALARAAYARWIPVIGREPTPMTADYDRAVAPERQGEGLGARLLARADETARALGLPELRLGTNQAFAANLRFYAAQGFEVMEEKPYLNGVAVSMRRPVVCASA